jgi:hypothetical protein
MSKGTLGLIFLCGLQAAFSQPAITTWHNDNMRTGQNLQETILTPANVNPTQFGKVFSYSVDGNIYAQPLYVPNVTIPNKGVHNVIYVATENDSVYAFDADSRTLNPSPLWYTNVTNPPNVIPYPCLDNHKGCNIYPIIGITGTPVINLATNKIYFVARTKEIVTGQTLPYYYERLHALDITTGAEVPGSPYTICGSQTNVGCKLNSGPFNPLQAGQRAALLWLPQTGFPEGVVFAGFAGKGMMMAFDAQTLNRVADWTVSPNFQVGDQGASGIWGSGGALSADSNGNVYVSVADGNFDANVAGGKNYGDSVIKIKLTKNNSTGKYFFKILDYFTPVDQQCRAFNDIDLGSGVPMLVPRQLGPAPNLIVVGGKTSGVCDSNPSFYLVNRGALGHLGGELQDVAAPLQGYWSSPAYWSNGTQNFVYMSGVQTTSAGDSLRQFALVNGQFNPITSISNTAATFLAGTTPSVSSNGTSNGVLWTIERPAIVDNEKATIPAVLHAYPAVNVSTELYNSNMNASRDKAGYSTKFLPPVIVNGKVYVGTQTELDVYGLCPCPQQ